MVEKEKTDRYFITCPMETQSQHPKTECYVSIDFLTLSPQKQKQLLHFNAWPATYAHPSWLQSLPGYATLSKHKEGLKVLSLLLLKSLPHKTTVDLTLVEPFHSLVFFPPDTLLRLSLWSGALTISPWICQHIDRASHLSLTEALGQDLYTLITRQGSFFPSPFIREETLHTCKQNLNTKNPAAITQQCQYIGIDLLNKVLTSSLSPPLKERLMLVFPKDYQSIFSTHTPDTKGSFYLLRRLVKLFPSS